MERVLIDSLKSLFESKKVNEKIDSLLSEELTNNNSCDNLYSCFDLQAKLVNLQIFVGEHKIEVGDLDLDELMKDFESVVVKFVKKFYHPKNNAEFFEIVCKNYLAEGFEFHGTSKKHFLNIKANGLNGNDNYQNVEMLREVNDIFLKHNRRKCFEGKVSQLMTDSFYVSDSAWHGIYYSNQSPEYLSRFCANGHITFGNEYDTFAYFRRDKKECHKNLDIFCDLHNFTSDEKKKVLECFNLIWKENVQPKEEFALCLVPRKLTGRTDAELVANLRKQNVPKKELINILIRPRHVHDRITTPVASKDLLFLPLINLQRRFKNSNRGQRYILKDEKKYTYDLCLEVPYKRGMFYIFNAKSHVDLGDLTIFSKKETDDIIKQNCLILANECNSNTPLGKEVIEMARTYISLNELKRKLFAKAVKDFKKCKVLLEKDIDRCFERLCDMFFDYGVILKVIVDNNDWYSNLDTGAYYTAYKAFDPGYLLSKAKNSKVYDYELLSQRLKNFEDFLNQNH